jgi:hypothetical protein
MARKVSTKVTKQMEGVGLPPAPPDPFKQNLEAEKQEKSESLAKYKLQEPDGFSKLIAELFKLESVPGFKTNFTDSRWPRNEIGENIKVERVYFFAMRGPREALHGYRSLGDGEINSYGKIIVDRLPKDYDQKLIMARKWLAEQTGYRFVWITEDEIFEDDKAVEIFLSRMNALESKPAVSYATPANFRSMVSADPMRPTQWT